MILRWDAFYRRRNSSSSSSSSSISTSSSISSSSTRRVVKEEDLVAEVDKGNGNSEGRVVRSERKEEEKKGRTGRQVYTQTHSD